MKFEDYYSGIRDSMSSQEAGICCDVDDTISGTNLYWAQFALENFGNPESISAQELVKRYRYVRNVPYFGADVTKWVEEHIQSNSAKLDLPVIPRAVESLEQICRDVPLKAYLSGRPEKVLSGTSEWLKLNRFPESKIILQPSDSLLSSWGVQGGTEWKARLLDFLYPHINTVIDDDETIPEFLKGDFQGRVYLFSHNDSRFKDPRVICCADWEAVLQQIALRN